MSRPSRLPKSNLVRAAGVGLIAAGAIAAGLTVADASEPGDGATTTPIKHVVVLFQENTSFDHVFGTYPNAVNAPGDIPFTPQPGTPAVNGLTPTLLTANPNGANPKRIAPADVIPTIGCGNNHGYTAEQLAMHGGLMDKFIQNTQGGGCGASGVLNYLDGNTVTGLWNYASHYAMSDNHYGTGFGPSTIGAIELISGNTSTAVREDGLVREDIPGTVRNGTVIGNANPYTSFDGCSGGTGYALGTVTGAAAQDDATNPSRNVGDLLNKKSVSWGWFQGGFKPTSLPGAPPVCGSSHKNVAGALVGDYDAHHNPFSYYKSTANPNHLPPTAAIGSPDPSANHNYDESDFDAAVAAGALPAVSFVKASHYQDGHPGYSDPIDEQRFLVEKINAIQASPDWASTAIFIAWDDSDGWYDHQMPPIVRSSATPDDALSGAGQCSPTAGQPPALKTTNGRCGFGPRLPLLLISPYAKPNYVKHTANDQTSILKFIEDNWNLGTIASPGNQSTDIDAASLESMFDFAGPTRNGKLLLDPATGAPPGTERVKAPVTETPGGGGGGTPSPAPSPTPPVAQPDPPKPTLGKLTLKTKLKTSKTVSVAITAEKSPTVKTAVRVRLLKGKTVVATSSTTIKSKKLTVTLKSKKAIKHGKYLLVVTVTPAGGLPTSQTKSIKL